jgi:hypothetical protein
MAIMASGGRPGAARVDLSDSRGDSIEAGRGRVRLKLSAIAYAHCLSGLDTGSGVTEAALEMLISAAIYYWEALMNKKYKGDADPKRAKYLKVAAIAYANARHGVDANIEICRAGLGGLCEAAIKFCEE